MDQLKIKNKVNAFTIIQSNLYNKFTLVDLSQNVLFGETNSTN